MLYYHRKECGWNVTRTSVFHVDWKRDSGTFPLLDYHDYCKLSGNTFCVATGTGASKGSGVGTQYQRCLALSEVISRHQREATDATFSSLLTVFSKVLDNLK